MQHVLPSRNVCVAYHGMTIPLPAPSLCGAFRNSMKEQKTFLTNEAIEGGSKDSGFQSQITTASDVSCTGSVTTSLSGTAMGRCSDQKKGEDKLMQTGNCDTSLCGEVQPVLKLPTKCESNVANSSVCSPTECTHITEIKTPPTLLSSKVVEEPLSKQVWAHVGRGRALQQLVSQLTQSVGRSQASTADSVPSQMNSVASYGSGSVSPDHPVHGLRKTGLCADTLEKLDAVEEDVAICCNLENPAPFLVPPSPSGSCLSQADNDVSDSVTAENGCGAVSDTKQEACSSPDELVVESNSSTELIDVIATVGCAKSNRCSPEKQIEIETTHLVNEVRAGVSQPPLSGNTSCAEKATYNTGGKTPKSSRKAKISLAIQFKGICTPQLAPERATTSITKGTPCPHEYEGRCKAPSGAVLLKPSDFAQLGPSSVSADKQLDRKECRVADVKNEELMAQANSESEELATECTLGDLQLVRGVEKKEERDVESPLSILTQVSEKEDYDQDLSFGQSGSDDKELEVDPPVARTELNEETLSLEHPRHLSPLSNLVLSSDEDVEESVGSRMGRSADEIEKSIAHHQRNIHRNRVCEHNTWSCYSVNYTRV